MDRNDVLTLKEAAELLRLNLDPTHRLLRDGQLPGRKLGPRQWRIRRSDLDDYLRPPSNGAVVEIRDGDGANGMRRSSQ
jgi:excisionase family DNA binding protein